MSAKKRTAIFRKGRMFKNVCENLRGSCELHQTPPAIWTGALKFHKISGTYIAIFCMAKFANGGYRSQEGHTRVVEKRRKKNALFLLLLSNK